jgi:hypothetical protein
MRPGVMERLGLPYETLKAINPQLIYVSISGFGDSGPWKDKMTYDPVVQVLLQLERCHQSAGAGYFYSFIFTYDRSV